MSVSFLVELCVQREYAVGGVGCMGTSGNRGCQLVTRRVLNNFTDDVLTIAAGSLFQMLKVYW